MLLQYKVIQHKHVIGQDVLPDLSVFSWHQSEAHCTVGLWRDPSVPAAHWYSAKLDGQKYTLQKRLNGLRVAILKVTELPLGERHARRLSSRGPLGFWHAEM